MQDDLTFKTVFEINHEARSLANESLLNKLFDPGMGGDGLEAILGDVAAGEPLAEFVAVFAFLPGETSPCAVCAVEYANKKSKSNFLQTFVSENFRGNGLGRKIVKKTVDEARKIGLTVSGHDFNLASQGFYKSVLN